MKIYPFPVIFQLFRVAWQLNRVENKSGDCKVFVVLNAFSRRLVIFYSTKASFSFIQKDVTVILKFKCCLLQHMAYCVNTKRSLRFTGYVHKRRRIVTKVLPSFQSLLWIMNILAHHLMLRKSINKIWTQTDIKV